MTAYPDPTAPTDSGARRLPGMIRAIASVGLMFGLLGLACQPFTAIRVRPGATGAGETDLISRTPEGTWLVVTTVCGMALSLLLVIASVGCLRLRRWGRSLMILYAVASLVVGIGGGYFYYRALGLAREGLPGAQRGPEGFIALMGWILGVLYAAWALYGMTRAHSKEAFRPGPPAGGAIP